MHLRMLRPWTVPSNPSPHGTMLERQTHLNTEESFPERAGARRARALPRPSSLPPKGGSAAASGGRHILRAPHAAGPRGAPLPRGRAAVTARRGGGLRGRPLRAPAQRRGRAEAGRRVGAGCTALRGACARRLAARSLPCSAGPDIPLSVRRALRRRACSSVRRRRPARRATAASTGTPRPHPRPLAMRLRTLARRRIARRAHLAAGAGGVTLACAWPPARLPAARAPLHAARLRRGAEGQPARRCMLRDGR